jgi:5'-nucleotidase
MESIHIYHTNDLHSHLKRWPRIHEFLISQRIRHEAVGDDFFLFDIGDFADRWHPLTEGTMGQGNIDLLNDSLYTAVTIGNNEGITFPYEGLNHLYDHASFDVLCANLYNSASDHPNWLKPYTVYETKKGTRIGVIGVTAYFFLLYELLGWNITEPIEELKKWLNPLKQEADIIILLSHLGLSDDERIAADCPEIDVILGGHTHHALPEGKLVNQTLIAGAGKHGRFVGHVTLNVNDQDGTDKQAVLYNVMELAPVADEKIKAKELTRRGKKLLSEKIVTLTEPLNQDPFQFTEISQILCQGLREWCDADCALINGGLILDSLSGTVTSYDLLKICPHPINPCKIELSGSELKEIILETSGEDWQHRPLTGLGFRGTVMGITIYDQITFDKDNVIFINIQILDLEKNYTLAIPDLFTFGHFFKDIFPKKQKQYYLPEFLRDLLKWKLQKLD